MPNVIDARGLACPQPVILTRNAMKGSGGVTILSVTTIVDDETAQKNVTRMAEKAGATVRVEQKDDGIYLHIGGGAAPQEEDLGAGDEPPAGPLVLVVASEFMGRGAHDELGNVLMRGFFHTLGEVQPTPDKIVFLNSGVKLTVDGSPVLEDLGALSQRGVEILACGTCLGYYKLKERVAVGEISNMYTIAETMLGAGKVINL
jgi:selenium metabolism protein YedF